MKALTTALGSAAAWVASYAVAYAGAAAPPPAVDNDNGNEGILLLVLLGAVVFAVAKGKEKPVEEGAPEIVDAEDGAGTGKY
jgi:hypothetical protein